VVHCGWRLGLLCRYVDVILELTEKAGEFVSDDIWYRVVHMVTNHEDLQVRRPASAASCSAPALAYDMVFGWCTWPSYTGQP